MTRRDILLVLAIFILTRAALFGIGALTVATVPANEGEEFTHLLDGGPALDMWYRWDAGFYTSIATYGYDWYNEGRAADDMAFLPVYPLLVRAASGLTAEGCAWSPYWSTCATIGGLVVSNLALLASTLLLFDLARRRFSRATAWRALWLLMLAPNTIFLSGVYTEATFLLWALLTFWLLERDQFLWALIPASLACLTRSVGVALYPALLWYAWTSTDAAGSAPRWLKLTLAHLPPLIFAGYILGIGLYAGDPLAYFSAYSTTWRRVSASPIEAFTIYFTSDQVSFYGWWVSWIDLAMTLFYLALAVIWLLRRDRFQRAGGAYALTGVAIPIASGTLLGMPRFGAVLFPFYLLLAAWADRWWKQALLYGASVALALLFITRFVTWRWIA